MTYYLDTSLLVSALTIDSGSAAAQGWLLRTDPDQLAISHWVVTEFSAALSKRQRGDRFTAEDQAAALRSFGRMMRDYLRVLAVTVSHFTDAARFADNAASGLRAGDALHLAIAAEAGLELVTRDVRLAAAGVAIGVRTSLI